MTNDITTTISQLQQNGSLRQLRPLSGRSGCRVEYQDATLLNLTSNDYLGIAGDHEIHQEFYALLNKSNVVERYGLGTASSRLLSGDSVLAHSLENEISGTYNRSACLLFNSGYHANIGILPALTGKKDLILSDKLNHASIIDGLRLSRATFKRFRHLDYDHLHTILEAHREKYEKVVIVTESVFSMDGDEADLHRLIDLKQQYDCLLYVDEAHSVGVYGEKGLGKAEEKRVIDEVDLLIGTFGKAFASVGAFLVCDEHIRQYLINFSRSLIFTTALPPVILSWNSFIFHKIITMGERRENLKILGNLLRKELSALDIPTGGESNIVPVIIGDNRRSMKLAEQILEHGYLIFAVRPPTVPEGTARFRLSLTADMTWPDLAELPAYIKEGLHRS